MLLVLALALLLQAQVLVDIPTVRENPHATPADIELGRKLYGGRCAGCHGPMGDGGKGTNLATPILSRAPDDLALWKIIRFGLPETEMPLHNLTNKEIWQIAGFVRTLGRIDQEIVTGDPKRGETLAKGKGGCLGCHRIHTAGGDLGPVLSGIGIRRSPSYLRLKLTDPNADAAGFYQVRLITNDGKSISGIRMNEDLFSIQLRDENNRIHSFWKEELKKLQVEQRTLMPSYSSRFTSQEIDDVVAYLAGLRDTQ